MAELFSYVVNHDYGFAPSPFGGFCTLAKCKYGTKKRNIVELAEIGDWIAGTGGVDLRKSAGHGKLIYAMRVDEIISLEDYPALFLSRHTVEVYARRANNLVGGALRRLSRSCPVNGGTIRQRCG